MSTPPTDPTDDEIISWVRSICVLSGVQSVAWNNGTIGLVNVPMKYLRIVDAMHSGMVALAHGEPLPRLVPAANKHRKGAWAP